MLLILSLMLILSLVLLLSLVSLLSLVLLLSSLLVLLVFVGGGGVDVGALFYVAVVDVAVDVVVDVDVVCGVFFSWQGWLRRTAGGQECTVGVNSIINK